MIITGIEVVPGDPAPQAPGGDGEAGVSVAPGEKLELTYGDKLRIAASLDYQGSAQKVTLYGSIGKRHPIIGFSEYIGAESTIPLPDSLLGFTTVPAAVDIPITADIGPGGPYDLYVKIKEYPGAGLPQVDGVITITGRPPSFTLLEETIDPYSYVYDGATEVCTFTFKTDPFTPTSWVAGILASRVKDEVEKAGGRLLSMRVYVDKSALLWTDWRIEAEGVPPKTTTGLSMSLGIVWWAIAILAALAIVLIIVITWSVKTIVASFTHKPISEDIKKAWSKETLIKVINDFETKLKRTPTPAADLQKKTDDELRSYCDELASAVAPAPAGLGLAIGIAAAAGVGLLLVGALAFARPAR